MDMRKSETGTSSLPVGGPNPDRHARAVISPRIGRRALAGHLSRAGAVALASVLAASPAPGVADSTSPESIVAVATVAESGGAGAAPPETTREVRTVTYANGDRYEGEWQGGRPHGRGAYTWASGDRYEGEWRAGRMHGRGTYVWTDGTLYEGGWREGLKHGAGTYSWSDGDRMRGEWRGGRRQVSRPDCLTVEKTAPHTALWINRCETGVDVLWRDEGACGATAQDRWPCSWYIGPKGSARAAIEGQVWWRECTSSAGLSDVVAAEKDDGTVYCVDDASLPTMARTRRKRQHADSNVRAADAEARLDPAEQPRATPPGEGGDGFTGAPMESTSGSERQAGGGESDEQRPRCLDSASDDACGPRAGETM